MANGFSPQIFSEGAVTLNTNPYVNFYAQTLAKKQAKDEALDQYYQNLFKQINPAGARTQDIPLFTEKVNEWQKFYQQNKDSIRNPRLDGGRAASEFQSRLVDAQNHIQQSKNEAKTYQDLVPLLRDPDKRSRIPDTVINDLAIHDLPLGDPRRKSFNLSALTFDPKPFDVTAQKNYLQGVQQGLKMDEEIAGITADPKSFTQTITTKSAFGEDAKNAIRNRASGAYGSDPSLRHFVDTELSKPENYQRLNDVFKKSFGTDIKNPEDLAAAYTLGSLQEEQVKQKTEADWKARQDYLQGQRINLLNRKQAADRQGKLEDSTWINDFVDVLKEQSMLNPPLPFKYKTGTTVEEYDIPMDATLSKILTRGKDAPDFLRYNPKNGQFRPIFLEYKDGEPVKGAQGKYAVDDLLSQPISEAQLKLALGGKVTPTQRTREMKDAVQRAREDGQIKYKVEGKPYTHQDLLKMGYSEQEIREAIKAGIIKK